MVIKHTDTQTISTILNKLLPEHLPENDRIKIESSFNRGDEESGVWKLHKQKDLIDSIIKQYPTGIFTFVRDITNQNWFVLDSGNRLRSLRDFRNDIFRLNERNLLFTELNEQEKAIFDNTLIPCQWITIENSDPDNTISIMFNRLNTTGVPLKCGELLKSHDFRQNIWEIQLAKKIIGHVWGEFEEDEDINFIKTEWELCFGVLLERSRCENLALLVGFIVSAKNSSFRACDLRYEKLSSYLGGANTIPTEELLSQILSKIKELLRIVRIIDRLPLFKPTRGGPNQSKISYIWYNICENYPTSDMTAERMINFFSEINENDLTEYYEICASGSRQPDSFANQKSWKITNLIIRTENNTN